MTEPIGDADHRTADDPSRSGSPSIAPSILIPRVLAGDLDAFEALYRAHSGEVYALCLRMSGDVSAAQELVQDVFVRAWERLASFRSESAFGSWLHRLAVNVVLENFRSNRRRIARITPEADLRQFPDAVMGSSPDERIDLDTAIAKLSSGARMAFVLHDIEGYTHDEIATLTGLAAGTIRTQVFRARQLLMRTLS